MTEQGNGDFLGRGWGLPVRVRADRRGVAMAEGEEDIRQAILIILQTEVGERILRPEFGVGLRALIGQSNSAATRALAKHRVEEALIRWEPRIQVEAVEVLARAGAPNVMDIRISYQVRRTNTFYNLVYPFYLQENKT